MESSVHDVGVLGEVEGVELPEAVEFARGRRGGLGLDHGRRGMVIIIIVVVGGRV